MGEYSKSTTVRVAPDRLFAYLSDVRNLPSYMPQLTSVEPLEGDKVHTTATISPGDEPEHEVEGEAWMHVVEAGRTLEWGSEGPNDYHGALDVDAGDDAGTSTLTVRLNTVRDEGAEVEQGLEETLNGLRDAVESAESSGSGR